MTTEAEALRAEVERLRAERDALREAWTMAERALEGRYPWYVYGKFSAKEARETALKYGRAALSKVRA